MTEREARNLRFFTARLYKQLRTRWVTTICKLTGHSPSPVVEPQFHDYLNSLWEDEDLFVYFHQLASYGYQDLINQGWNPDNPNDSPPN